MMRVTIEGATFEEFCANLANLNGRVAKVHAALDDVSGVESQSPVVATPPKAPAKAPEAPKAPATPPAAAPAKKAKGAARRSELQASAKDAAQIDIADAGKQAPAAAAPSAPAPAAPPAEKPKLQSKLHPAAQAFIAKNGTAPFIALLDKYVKVGTGANGSKRLSDVTAENEAAFLAELQAGTEPPTA